MVSVNIPELCFCACLCSPSCLHPLLVLPPGKPSAWCVRPFQGPKELYGRERYMGWREQSSEKRWAERENECWWKLQWGWRRGNIIRYSVTPPCSIYSTPSATCTFLSLSLFKNWWKTEREEERQSDCTWKREAEEHEERWRGSGLRVCGRSSSPRCEHTA